MELQAELVDSLSSDDNSDDDGEEPADLSPRELLPLLVKVLLPGGNQRRCCFRPNSAECNACVQILFQDANPEMLEVNVLGGLATPVRLQKPPLHRLCWLNVT